MTVRVPLMGRGRGENMDIEMVRFHPPLFISLPICSEDALRCLFSKNQGLWQLQPTGCSPSSDLATLPVP